jgi:hypothetical protein
MAIDPDYERRVCEVRAIVQTSTDDVAARLDLFPYVNIGRSFQPKYLQRIAVT